ncbi:MAG: T9SS type A sorting domain-containing protein [Bacteroidota bacterium]|nr:T9SS type A sorting domain-containing protein [Bacteroidota bacterium]MDX5429808.1 T9SS type A sorting domain-containing protein [Bacteroidota bacterium]MDX5468587.1 T9SS type A sorting domain-containing protein [Bacteroidota bacterium]
MYKMIQQALVLALGLFCLAQNVHATSLLSPSDCVTETYVTEHICGGDSFYFNQQWLKSEGNYQANVLTSQGCDSIIFLTLWHMPSSKTELQLDLCEGSSLEISGHQITQGGTYQFHYQASWGCDSTVIIHVNEISAPKVKIARTLCEGDSLFFGSKYYHEAGTYTAKFARSGSCDSIVELSLHVITTRGPIQQQTDGLYAAIPVESYQWLACPSFFAIPNANQPKLTVAGSGNYALRVENRGCIDTLDCIYFSRTTTDFNEVSEPDFQLYPNPASSFIKIEGRFEELLNIEIYDLKGQKVHELEVQPETIILIDLQGLSKGRYILRMASQQTHYPTKLFEIR